MTKQKQRHFIVEHIWRAVRAILILSAMIIWLAQDGFNGTDWLIVSLGLGAHLTEQFHGYICNIVEKILHWKQDFNDWD